MSGVNGIQERITSLTLMVCALNCLAYEAIRINGWLNRFASEQMPFWDVAISRWQPLGIAVYLSIFLIALVVICNRSNPRVRMGWFLFSLLMLGIACFNIPGARVGRFGSTNDLFTLFYLVVTPLPAIAFAVFGLLSRNGARSDEWAE